MQKHVWTVKSILLVRLGDNVEYFLICSFRVLIGVILLADWSVCVSATAVQVIASNLQK